VHIPNGREKIEEVNTLLKKEAEKGHFLIIDLANVLTVDKNVWFEDGLHPNAAGYALMAQVVSEALQKH
jgi:lysophospholipase L1-like esterase